jgi:agmatine/peptidylarginine deiminase
MDESLNAVGDYIWECFPENAGFTLPPPLTSRFPTESEQTRGVLYGWPSFGCQMPELTELIRNSIRNVETIVMVPSDAVYASAVACLQGRGFSDDDLAQITWFSVPTPYLTSDEIREFTIWIRDYGPEILLTPTGTFQYVDMGYYSGPSVVDCDRFGGRPNSDTSPTAFAPSFLGGVEVFRPQLRTEGGNLQTDGRGTCVHMQRDVLRQNQFSRWSYTQEQLDAVYRDYYNCNRVITLESFQPDPGPVRVEDQVVIDHVDMFMTFISPTKVLVGQLDPEDAAYDKANAAILDRNADTLAAAGYNVVRIPQPRRYCTLNTDSCIANPGAARTCDATVQRVWATYANSIRVGNKMLVPVYRDVPAELADAIAAQEAVALVTFQNELDAEFGVGVVQVVPIVSDSMIPCQGSVHCISMTYGPRPAP